MLAEEKNKYQQIWKETRSSTHTGNDKTKNYKHTLLIQHGSSMLSTWVGNPRCIEED